ncbi:stage V sporulation protein AB [Priestia koreensis]|uniref:Stage V sporulation protein AB n=2 Tax=Bacteria TaxID=2 RepID=A0A0M0L061_9BACI|nr:stage V sporulation protein AB [Priestia koreensis]KOO44038.1 stage V sporulation protein AB [Priestia koreensis]MCM3003981.1 stage V sporulation protein AB [Priestia koreensis]UNL84074.1 stage V sporulation protein AB [Priestia koreensis]
MTIRVVLTVFIGMAGGLAVGSGFVAFLTVLGIIPRLMQLTKTMKYIRGYEWGVVAGAVGGGWFSLNHYSLHLPLFVAVIVGTGSGMFIGMLAAGLTEVLNVLPIMAKRIGIDEKIVILLMAIVLGKVMGSLFHWIYFVEL